MSASNITVGATWIARHYLTGVPQAVSRRAAGLVVAPAAAGALPHPDLWVAPALFDLQVNGYAGVDFQSDTVSTEDLRRAVAALRQAACSRFLLTLITDDWGSLTARFRRLRAMRAADAELRYGIAGWHIEGPFLSAEPGFCGTHSREFMLDPTPDHIRQLADIAQGDPVLLTLAPERPGALKCIEVAREHGFRVSLGHTNASSEILREAVASGASAFTHLGNGCTSELNRHDNILWRVLDGLDVTVSVIPDTIHVRPALFRLFHRLLPPNKIFYVTDCMTAAGAPPGVYTLGKLSLQVGADGIVRQPGSPYLSGSALQPLEGVLRAVQMLGCGWQEAWERFSVGPARLMGLEVGLERQPGAHVCLLRTGKDTRGPVLVACGEAGA